MRKQLLLITFLALGLFSGGAFAHYDDGAEGKVMDKKEAIEMHEFMSDVHKKAAECVRSGKSENECHEAMMAACKEHCKGMKGDHCPMMDHDGMKMQKHRHDKNEAAKAPDTKE